MSLATYAAPYNESNMNNNNVIEEKRRYRNKTLKKRDNKSSNPKVNAMMKQIYSEEDEEYNNNMSDFQPLGAPESASMLNSDRGMKEQEREHYDYDEVLKQQQENDKLLGTYGDDANENNMFQASQQGIMYNGAQQSYGAQQSFGGQQNYSYGPSYNMDQDELMRKMNYIIYMLEQQKNEKTDNVMEELVLYTFLGVFVIFVVDSFARVGKYVR